MKVQLMVLIEALVQQRKLLVLILVKSRQIFAWVYIIRVIIVICLLMKDKYFKVKADNKNVNFPTEFCLGSVSVDLVILSLEKYF